MVNLVYDFYRFLFARRIFYRFNQMLYGISLRGLEILNFETDKQSGEDHFIRYQLAKMKNGIVFYRMLPDGLVPIKKYSPVSCEIFAYQNIVAKLKTGAN